MSSRRLACKLPPHVRLHCLEQADGNKPSILPERLQIGGLDLHQVPGVLLEKIAQLLQPHWRTLAESSSSFSLEFPSEPGDSVRDWIKRVSVKGAGGCKIDQVLAVADQVSQAIAVRNLLLADVRSQSLSEYEEVERQRIHFNKSSDMGYLQELTHETYVSLAKCIEDSEKWKLLADRLGFGNVSYWQLTSAYQMLQVWECQRPQYPVRSIARLHFEAKRLEMKATCHFLEAIPLEGASQVFFPAFNAAQILSFTDT